MNERSGFATIQAMRGVAALVVVLWHASVYISPYGTGLGTALFGSGWAAGVDLFFVISGFVMVHTTGGNDGSREYARDFFIKRIARIWPPYVVMTIAYVALSTLPLQAFLEGRPLQRVLLTVAFAPTALAPPAPTLELPMLRVGWSLDYEMYFYAVFGVCLLLGRLRWWGFFGWTALTLLVVPGVRGTLSVDPASPSGFGVAYLNLVANPIIWLFVAGVAIGLLHQAGARIAPRGAARAVLALASALWLAQYVSGFREVHGLLGGGLTAVPLVLAAVVAEKGAGLRLPWALTYLGDISFSLYLVHPIVVEGLPVLWQAFAVRSRLMGFHELLLATAVSICLAAVSHRCLERGLSDELKRRWLRGRRPQPAPIVAAESAIDSRGG